MPDEGLERIVREHPFFAGLDERYPTLVSGCAKNVRFADGDVLIQEGAPADQIYLIRHGRVVLQTHEPVRGEVGFLTLHEGDLVGVSAFIPPYRSTFEAKATGLVRAIAVDAKCLRGKCEADHDLGYEIMRRLVNVLIQRLHTTRLQVLDVYGTAD